MRYKLPVLFIAIIVTIFMFACQGPLQAQMFGSHHARLSAVTSVDAAVSPTQVKSAGRAALVVTIHLADGFHINSAKTNSPEWIPTRLTINGAPGIKVGKPVFPAAQSVKESYYDKPLLVYTGVPVIRVPITVVRGTKPGLHNITGTLSYQGCNDKTCLPPATTTISVTITVK